MRDKLSFIKHKLIDDFISNIVIIKTQILNTILHGKAERKRSRGRPWLDARKEWTVLSSNVMWREPEDRVTWRPNPNHVTTQWTEWPMAIKIENNKFY